jgi:hypothetical protein
MTFRIQFMKKLKPLILALSVAMPIAAVAVAPDRPVPAVSAKPLLTSLSPAQRGAAIGQFVRKWGPYVENAYGLDVATWSTRLVHEFVKADAANIQRALARNTFEGAMAELTGAGLRLSDEQAITQMAKATLSGSAQDPMLTAAAFNATADLVFTPVTPCRIVDTRVSLGPIPSGGTRDFAAWGQPNYGAWGGTSSSDCGMLNDHPVAVMLNVVSVRSVAAGYATVYSGDLGAVPAASSINYDTGAIENSIVVTKIGAVYPDFKIYTYQASNYVVDIVGYFAPPHATALECTDVASGVINIAAGARGTGTMPFCDTAAGYTAVFGGIAATGNSDNQTLNALDTDPTGFFYSMTNNSGATKSFMTHTRCCRVPGR